MNPLRACVLAMLSFLVLAAAPARSQDVLAPPAALVLEGVPPVPAAVAAQVAKYTDF